MWPTGCGNASRFRWEYSVACLNHVAGSAHELPMEILWSDVSFSEDDDPGAVCDLSAFIVESRELHATHLSGGGPVHEGVKFKASLPGESQEVKAAGSALC